MCRLLSSGRHEPTARASQLTIIRTIDITCRCPRRHFSLVETKGSRVGLHASLFLPSRFLSRRTRVSAEPAVYTGYTRVCARTYSDQVSRRFTCPESRRGSCAGVIYSVLWTIVVRAAPRSHVRGYAYTHVENPQKARCIYIYMRTPRIQGD